jgi:hypothetical protein
MREAPRHRQPLAGQPAAVGERRGSLRTPVHRADSARAHAAHKKKRHRKKSEEGERPRRRQAPTRPHCCEGLEPERPPIDPLGSRKRS